jgi:predicted enzyme related to lactoylglutathione lyase
MHLPGKFVWFDHVSKDSRRAQAFYGEVLGWKVRTVPVGEGTYDTICVGETMLGGYGPPMTDVPSHWASAVSVDDVDAATRTAAAQGGRVLVPPSDIPNVGRHAVVEDPAGAVLSLFRNSNGDPADVEDAPPSTFFWNELHTPDPKKVIPFYEKVVGYQVRGMDMGPAGTYFIVSRGGVDRGGITHHGTEGVPSHWLPYVRVADPDATAARAQQHGGTIASPCMDIPDIGRFCVIADPTGAVIAVMNPLPRR